MQSASLASLVVLGSLLGCGGKSPGGSSGTCNYTLSGAVNTNGASNATCSAAVVAISIGGNSQWNFEIDEDNGPATYGGWTCHFFISNSATLQTGTFTQATVSGSGCMVNTPNDKGDLSNNWQELSGNTTVGALSVTITSMDPITGDAQGWTPHGNMTFTLQANGSTSGTVIGAATF